MASSSNTEKLMPLNPRDALELEELKTKFAARNEKPGWKANAAAIKLRIEELQRKELDEPGS